MVQDVNYTLEFEDVQNDRRKSTNEKRWRLSYLKDGPQLRTQRKYANGNSSGDAKMQKKAQFTSLALDHLYARYIERISHGYLSQFLTLQILLAIAHFIIVLAANFTQARENLSDLILYGTIVVVSILLLILTDTYVKRKPNLLKFFAGIEVGMIFFANIFIPLYYGFEYHLRPAYTVQLLISNYIFLNIQNDLLSIVIGIFISVVHLVTLISITYDVGHAFFYRTLIADILYMLCINCLGIYFRYINEIVIRRTFLDKRACVEKTHQLKFEEEHENLLMSSIIPHHILERVQRDFNKHASETPLDKILTNPFKDLYVDEHPDVSILFADIVNYTVMTTRLSATDLLDVMNELFGRFDDASVELGVLRIKFLGDCYYCVAGLIPSQSANHAEACVNLGLKMITIINDIKTRKKLDIDMRIGVHSGKISGGIIGAIKWQYDIWSADVDLANKMETEGEPGKVHITKRTKDLLQKPYRIISTHKLVNQQETFLIAPREDIKGVLDTPNNNVLPPFTQTMQVGNSSENQRRPTIFKKHSRGSINLNSKRSSSLIEDSRQQNEDTTVVKRHTFPEFSGVTLKRCSIRGNIILTPNERKRRTAFMNNNIHRYQERLEATNKELEATIEEMRVSKYEQWIKNNDDVFRFWMLFKDLKKEINFIKMPDPLFKYYLIGVVLLLLLSNVEQNITLQEWDWDNIYFYITMSLTLFLFLPITWIQFIWSRYSPYEPRNKIIKSLYKTSTFITNNTLARALIYYLVYALFCVSVLYEWKDCPKIRIWRSEIPCTVPWRVTETCTLAIITSFIFLRMYMWLKLLCAAVMATVYTLCVYEYTADDFYDDRTERFNHLLDPKITHVMVVIFLTLTLHLVDRQTEYMNRIEYLWYQNLIKKEEEANHAHHINTVLLKNILPIHVAELYLNLNRDSSEEVYHENYNEASIMFASITNYSTDEIGDKFLHIMNVIISDFDEILSEFTNGRPIEKIKVAKWTYMAACGLAPGLGNVENLRRDSGTHVVLCLVKFAAKLMKQMEILNKEMVQDFKLRIGICHGFVTAGVVGSKKPLYDVWGDPVNMASRMDTTGVGNRIQVLKHTAEIIKGFGYLCHYRGLINVKGRDHPVPTYFVALDEDFNLIRTYNF